MPTVVCQYCGVPFFCENTYAARRLCCCWDHWVAWKRLHEKQRMIERFWAHVDKARVGCWLWNGALDKEGYGHFWMREKNKNVPAHRFSYELHYGLLLDTQFLVCHNCPGGDKPACVKPQHLFIGTPYDNAIDAVRKGRFRTGEQHHWYKNPAKPAKINDAGVRFIREQRYIIPARELAHMFGVSQGYIYHIWYKIKRYNV